MKKLLLKTLPWFVTIAALYIAFKGVDWAALFSHLREASLVLILSALLLTVASYLMRSRRWQFLFPTHSIDFWSSARVLTLGFFMNNILPARAGEFVRAHLGSKATGKTRTLVLATIASERLVDGLTLSVMFLIFALGMGDPNTSKNLLYVAYLFVAATLSVIAILIFHEKIIAIAHSIAQRRNSSAASFMASRAEAFLHGLTPLYSPKKLPVLLFWSIVIWCIELAVYVVIQNAYGANLSLHACVLFMVAVNFSSLIPAAPGGIGVIEAVASAVLISLGVEKEHALSMVLTQHAIQYLVVGIPGAIIMLTSQKQIEAAAASDDTTSDERLNAQP